jgi:hypothetical protein
MIARFATAAVLTGALLASGSAAHANVTAADAAPATGAAVNVERVPVNLRVPAECFGYTGNFMPGSTVLRVDWEDANTAPDECFGVAPNRTIWHAWPGSGGWKEMPNNGRADDTWLPYYSNDGRRGISVYVASANGTWCSTRNHGPGWGAWFRCTV